MADPDFTLGALEERVTGLERGVEHISASLDSLGRDMRERSKFPWPAVWGGVSVLLVIVGMFGGIVIWGFNSYLTSLQANMTGLQSQIITLDASIVPRGEHAERWRALEAADANAQRQIDQIRSDFGSTFSLNDTLKSFQERLERLEQLRLEQSVQ